MYSNLPQLSTSGPAVVDVAGIGMILAYFDAANDLNLMLAPDRANYEAPFNTRQQTFASPSLASLIGRVFVAWVTAYRL
jgi:hypothetical protein